MQSNAPFQAALAELRTRFPWLVVREVPDHPQVDAFAEIPVQPGLSLPVQINLQNADELHLVASHLWVEWFPCTHSAKLASFVEAVSGLISGELVIQECFVLGRPAVSTLRYRDGSGRTVARWSSLWALVPLPRTCSTVRNDAA